jgi:MoxR-like ATPase
MADFFFESAAEVKRCLGEQSYISSDEIATIVFLSQQLGKNRAGLKGPAGVGKTESAKAIAAPRRRTDPPAML